MGIAEKEGGFPLMHTDILNTFLFIFYFLTTTKITAAAPGKNWQIYTHHRGVNGQPSEYRNVFSGVPQGRVLGRLPFILYAHDMWFRIENMIASCANDVLPIVYTSSKISGLILGNPLTEAGKISAGALYGG